MTANRHLVLAAGGTGGHMVPADAVASELTRRGHRVTLMSDPRGLRFPGLFAGLERRVIESAVAGGLNPLAWARTGLGVLRGRSEALGFMRAEKVAAVVGFGGYPVVPPLLAAGALGLPTILHEQNAVCGRANRLLSPRARVLALGYERTARVPAGVSTAFTGNPVRPSVLEGRERPFRAPSASEPFHLLVTGGSQGARVLSRVLPEAGALLAPELRARLRVVHQARPEDVDAARAAWAAAGIAAEVASYFEDLPRRIADAHLVVARSGASTMAELAAIGRPALLVPFAAATNDHQTANARAFVEAGGGTLLTEAECTSANVAGAISGWMLDSAAVTHAAAAARGVGAPDAASRLADLVEKQL